MKERETRRRGRREATGGHDRKNDPTPKGSSTGTQDRGQQRETCHRVNDVNVAPLSISCVERLSEGLIE